MTSATALRIAMIGVRGLASEPPPRFVENGRLAVGGAELAAEELAMRLASRGHLVTLFSRGGRRMRVSENLTVQPTWYAPGRRTEAISHTLWSTLHALRGSYDVLHFHAVGPGCCALLSRCAGVPSVLTIQGFDWEREKWKGWEGRLLRRLASIGIRHADACAVVAPSLVAPVEALGGRKVAFIPNGFSAVGKGSLPQLEAWGLQPGRFLLTMSRLVPEKNIHRIIEAYRNSGVTWPLVIAGGSSETESYVEDLRRLAGGSAGVRFVGVVRGSEKATLLEHAGAFLNASSIEGLSLALVEALGLGIPVGISPIAANLDVFAAVPNAPEPVLLNPSDVPAMSRSLRKLAALPADERRAWSTIAEQVRRTFAWEDISQKVEDLYREVLQQRRGSSA